MEHLFNFLRTCSVEISVTAVLCTLLGCITYAYIQPKAVDPVKLQELKMESDRQQLLNNYSCTINYAPKQ